MTEDNLSDCLFSGKFKVVSLYLNTIEQGWTVFKRYENNSFLWEFVPDKTIWFRTGAVAYVGKLKEYFNGRLNEVMEYAWCPEDRLLYLDRSDYEPNGFCNVCINDHYKVERINKSDFWLYDLDSVKNEPEDYWCKMKIRLLMQ